MFKHVPTKNAQGQRPWKKKQRSVRTLPFEIAGKNLTWEPLSEPPGWRKPTRPKRLLTQRKTQFKEAVSTDVD